MARGEVGAGNRRGARAVGMLARVQEMVIGSSGAGDREDGVGSRARRRGGDRARLVRAVVVIGVGSGSGRCADGFGIGVNGTRLDGECDCGGVSSGDVGELIDGGVGGNCANSIRTEVMFGVGWEGWKVCGWVWDRCEWHATRWRVRLWWRQ